jgi:hypothetical protein
MRVGLRLIKSSLNNMKERRDYSIYDQATIIYEVYTTVVVNNNSSTQLFAIRRI